MVLALLPICEDAVSRVVGDDADPVRDHLELAKDDFIRWRGVDPP